MMQVIDIVPIANLGYIKDAPMGMFLTHLVEHSVGYSNFARYFKGYKILDNSLIELGDAVSTTRLVNAALAINADEIILPDVFRNGPATLASTEKALRECKKIEQDLNLERPFKYMGVCQGNDPREFAECFRRMLGLGLDVIGIPKVCAKLHPKGRPYFEYLWREMCWNVDTPPQIHLLGLWYNYNELVQYQYPKDIRSVDTCLATFFAKHSISPITGTRPDGFTVDLINDSVDWQLFINCRFKEAYWS